MAAPLKTVEGSGDIAATMQDIGRRAKEHPEWAREFTTERFLEIAGRYFDVSHQSYLGIRPLYLMKKK